MACVSFLSVRSLVSILSLRAREGFASSAGVQVKTCRYQNVVQQWTFYFGLAATVHGALFNQSSGGAQHLKVNIYIPQNITSPLMRSWARATCVVMHVA